MIKLICTVLFCLTAWLRVEGQGMDVHGSKIVVPKGNLLGAAFYEEKGMFFVQQSILSTENRGMIIRFHRQLSSWNIKSRSMVSTRAFDKAPEGASVSPCGRVEASEILHRIYLCSAESHLEVIDPDSLDTVGTIAQADDQIITDFAVDDPHGRVFVLSVRKDGSTRLVSYSLLNGEKQQETFLTVKNYAEMSLDNDVVGLVVHGMKLAVDARTGQIGISVNVHNHSRNKADIYTCVDSHNLVCTNIAQIDAVSQISFIGRQLLIATSNFADNKKECVLTVDPMTRMVSREYCSPSTGVHYAVGGVDMRYVVGFTGVSKRDWFNEENKSVASSFSVWRANTSQVAAVVRDPTDYGAFQSEIRVVASTTKPLFIAYQQMSNVLYLYSITETH